ncbi:hypothetical protein CHO01_35270 [Cellulomonas hominis]|uniref:Chromosome condensation regulator RCC1 n=1 Tax=Cellulomonas hominis TaxID=156981 RepID=A0A511FGT0_9CELL|nr:hypothetical protein [Cellulomonas hominis]MBB5471358.1 hypothetical protein [Cellulomonas hominis]GEL48411.1 hypothetical protein CHO01_35270 [Cellulomonas hominis]
MTRTRSALAGLAAAALAVVAVVASTAPTTAAYTDRAEAVTDVFASPTTRFVPQQTYLAGTAAAVQDDGTIAVWGYRGNGLSGTGTTTVDSAATISLVTLPSDGHPDGARRAVRLAGVSLDNYYPADVSYSGLAALSDDGRVYTWGGNQVHNIMGRTNAVPFNRPGQVSIPGTVVDLVSSASVFMALTDTGDLYTWGYAQSRGVTGQGTATASAATPTRILTGVHSIGAGVWNGWAIRGNTVAGDATTGVLWWGWANGAGAYAGDPSGDNVTTSRSTPTRSQALSALTTTGCDAVGVVAGSPEDTCRLQSLTGHYYGSQAVLDDGTLLTWGNYVEWGTGRTDGGSAANNTPTAITLAAGVTARQVATTEDYVLVLGSDGYAYVWGRYSYSYGPHPSTGATSNANIRTPTRMTALGQVELLAGTGYSGMALRADGTLVLWGGTTQGGSHNTHRVVRNGFATTTTPTTPSQGLTALVMPGTAAASA